MELEPKDKSLERKVIMALLLIIILLSVVYCNAKRDAETQANLQEVLKDSVEIWKNKDGTNQAKIRVFEARNAEDFTNLYTKDQTILRLQALVKENKSKLRKQGSVTTVTTEGSVGVTVPTTVTVVDTSKAKSPVYSSVFELRNEKATDSVSRSKVWVWGTTIARKDSTQINVSFREEIDLVIGMEKKKDGGWFSKKVPFADVKLHNPFNEVQDMRSYQVKLPPAKYFHVGPVAAYGLGNNLQFQWFVGAGIMWTPLNF